MMEERILKLLEELCVDFAPYKFLKNDLYKGRLRGGCNVYYKEGKDGTRGLVTGYKNIRIYGLDRFPTNFEAYAGFDGSRLERGWSGQNLLDMLESLKASPLDQFGLERHRDGRDIRILPMHASALGGDTVESLFFETVPNRGGRYYYGLKGNALKSPSGSLVLFQFQNALVASARLVEVNRGPIVDEDGFEMGGYYVFDPGSVKVLEGPISLEEFKEIAPSFSKQFSQAMHFVDPQHEKAIEDAFDARRVFDGGESAELDTSLETVVGETEGGQIRCYTTKYERNPKNRAAAIYIHGAKCQACGFDFEETYGELGKGFIEVHHAKPLSSLDGETVVNPIEDLVCLCSNCHRMVHRAKDSVLSLDELKALLESGKKA